jgi:D-alanyl-D-alanine carboxypeptidase/D-alanyl-D-alanine-endopeptidase (penicillin-binding protein 4)
LRLWLIGAANLAALGLLIGLLFGAGERGAVGAASRAALAGPTAAPAELPPQPSWLESEAGRALERDLERIVARWVERARAETKNKVHAGNVEVAVHVRELGGGPRAAIGFGETLALRPASNLKLVTTAAALVLLGADWGFETAFEARGPIVDGVLQGDLVVRAGGDPLYDPAADGAVAHLLAPVVDQLASAGLRAIAGDVVLDEGTFADPAPGPEWPEASQHWAEYCALAGGFSANRGALTAVVQARAAGQSARVGVQPASHGLAERLSVATTAGGQISVALEARASGVVVRGTIPAGVQRWSDSMAHPDPVELFGHALAAALDRGGVRLDGRVRRERGGSAGERLAALRSPWLPLLVPINTESANSVADQLFLATGLAVRGAGTRAAAASATAEALARLGVSSAGLVQVDGSGLSRANRVTAAQMTALLAAVLSGPSDSAQAFEQSLALAGETGTLEERMRAGPARGRVRAKTGYIGGTSSLSGVARGLAGHALVFSILVNYPSISGLNSSCWKPMQDELCERLVAAAP